MNNDTRRRNNEAYRAYAHDYSIFSRDYENFPGLKEVADQFLQQLAPGALILDAGCGTGRDSRYFAQQGRRVIAIDICSEVFRHWVDTKAVTLAIGQVVADMVRVPLSSRVCNGIWACASIVHLDELELQHCFLEFQRLLKPGGILVATFRITGETGWTVTNGIPVERWNRVVEPSQMEQECAAAGFKSVATFASGGDCWYQLCARTAF